MIDKNKLCMCNESYAVYNDLGIVRCQYCMGKITKQRYEKYMIYNGYVEENGQWIYNPDKARMKTYGKTNP